MTGFRHWPSSHCSGMSQSAPATQSCLTSEINLNNVCFWVVFIFMGWRATWIFRSPGINSVFLWGYQYIAKVIFHASFPPKHTLKQATGGKKNQFHHKEHHSESQGGGDSSSVVHLALLAGGGVGGTVTLVQDTLQTVMAWTQINLLWLLVVLHLLGKYRKD